MDSRLSSFVRTGEVHDYSGYQLIVRDSLGVIYLLPISLALLFLALSFRRFSGDEVMKGFLTSWRATLAAISAVLLLILPHLQFPLTYDVETRVGQGLGLVPWLLTYVASFAGVLTSLAKVRRSSELVPTSRPFRFTLPLAPYVIIALPVFALFVYSIIVSAFSNNPAAWEFPLGVASIALPMSAGPYFLDQGLRGGRMWAARASRLATVVLATGVVLGLIVGVIGGKLDKWIGVVSGFAIWWLVSTFLAGVAGIVLCYRDEAIEHGDLSIPIGGSK